MCWGAGLGVRLPAVVRVLLLASAALACSLAHRVLLICSTVRGPNCGHCTDCVATGSGHTSGSHSLPCGRGKYAVGKIFPPIFLVYGMFTAMTRQFVPFCRYIRMRSSERNTMASSLDGRQGVTCSQHSAAFFPVGVRSPTSCIGTAGKPQRRPQGRQTKGTSA